MNGANGVGPDGVGPRTGLVIVSHSARLAEGVVEVAAQMAPDVLVRAAGGTDDGGIGTSFTRVSDAVASLLDAGEGVVILTDLGSATMTAEMALELLGECDRARVVLADAPLVEGAVAAAIAAQTGGDADVVATAAAGAAGRWASSLGREVAHGPASGRDADAVERLVTLGDPSGLHARPAAALARIAAQFAARVTIDDVDATSALDLMGLALGAGSQVRIRAVGPDAARAVEAVADALELL